jgi:hypothetical protein
MRGYVINSEQLVKSELVVKTEVLKENSLQCHFIHYKSHIPWPRIESALPSWEGGDYSLSSRKSEAGFIIYI